MRRLLLVLPALIASAASAQARYSTTMVVPITIVTTVGDIEAYVDSVHAPITAANFLKYVDGHLFDSSSFFRAVTIANQSTDSVKIEVIQSRRSRGAGPGYPPIPLERTSLTGIKHLDGTLSMARSGPDTGSDQIFICIGDQPALDFGGHRNLDGQGFAAFGRVSKGMDIVRQIQSGVVNAQTLVAPVTILRIDRR